VQELKDHISPLLLEQCEAVIEQELQNFEKLSRALALIKEQALYKEEYQDFNDYCNKRWSIPDCIANFTIKEKK
jgi:hypothetical protein